MPRRKQRQMAFDPYHHKTARQPFRRLFRFNVIVHLIEINAWMTGIPERFAPTT